MGRHMPFKRQSCVLGFHANFMRRAVQPLEFLFRRYAHLRPTFGAGCGKPGRPGFVLRCQAGLAFPGHTPFSGLVIIGLKEACASPGGGPRGRAGRAWPDVSPTPSISASCDSSAKASNISLRCKKGEAHRK